MMPRSPSGVRPAPLKKPILALRDRKWLQLDVPLIVSYTADDAALRLTNFKVDAAGVKAELAKQYDAAKAER